MMWKVGLTLKHRKVSTPLWVAVLTSLTLLIAAPVPVQSAPEDLTDALLLYQTSATPNTDINFRKMAEYYGLRWTDINLAATPLTDSLLRDGAGRYYPTVGIDAATLSYLDTGELAVLEAAIDQGGLNLLITRVYNGSGYTQLSALTDGEVTGSTAPADGSRDYLLSASDPAILRELSSVTIRAPVPTPPNPSLDQQEDALTLSTFASHVRVLVQATADNGQLYPVFVRFQNGAGSIYVDSSPHWLSLAAYQFHSLYYARLEGDHFVQNSFMDVVPLMVFVRHTARDEAWHNDHNYANLTIDDPALVRPAEYPNYWTDLLAQMETHNYHTTVAFIPANYNNRQQDVVDLFRTRPDRYSLVFHGNNHDPCPEFTEQIPLGDQRADLEQAKQRMNELKAQTGIPYGRIMVFPCTLSGESTLPLLKELNYVATINNAFTPPGSTTSSAWDFNMYPAMMDYRNYAVVLRNTYKDSPYPFDLFRDKPFFIYGHLSDFASPAAMNSVADAVNGLPGGVEWRSLDYIMKRLFLEKRNDDGSATVQWYTNHLILKNETSSSRLYYLQKKEDGVVPIQSVTVNGVPHTYTVAGGLLQLELSLGASRSAEVIITYGSSTAAVPAAPAASVSIDEQDVVLSWPPVSAVTGYLVYVSEQPHIDRPDITPVFVTSTTYRQTGVIGSLTNYYYRVDAENIVGTSTSVKQFGKFSFQLIPGSSN